MSNYFPAPATAADITLAGDAAGVANANTVGDLTIASEAQGDVLVRTADGWEASGVGTDGQVLTSGGVAATAGFEDAAGGALAAWLSETVTASSNASADKYDVFDEDNYGTFTSTTNVTENGVTFVKATGAFTFVAAGTYSIECLLYLSSSGAQVDITLEIDASPVWTAQPNVNPSVSPTPRPANLLVTVTAGQVLHVFVDSTTGATVTVNTGTTMNIKKIG